MSQIVPAARHVPAAITHSPGHGPDRIDHAFGHAGHADTGDVFQALSVDAAPVADFDVAGNRADAIAAAADEAAGECADRRAAEQRVGVEGDDDGGFGAGAVDPV